MPIFQTENGLVFYSHIPKCGGMSIEKNLSFLPTHLKNPYLHGNDQQGFPCSPQHFHSDIILKMFDVSAFYYSFTVTRHPFNRLISEYRFRSDIAARQKQKMPEINSWIENIFSRYASNKYVLDNHIRPQHEFLLPDMDVMKLEDGMQSIFSQMSKSIDINIPETSAHINKSTGLDISVGFESKELIRSFYASDFETFDYADA